MYILNNTYIYAKINLFTTSILVRG